MKKILYFMTLLFFIGCQEEELFKSKQGNIRVMASFADTRITFAEDGDVTHVYWEKDDAIGLITDKQINLKYAAQAESSISDFSAVSPDNKLNVKEGTKVYAYYPYVKEADAGSITLPDISEQTYIKSENETKDFIYASGEVKDNILALQFKHLYSFLKLTIRTELFQSYLPVIQIYSNERLANTISNDKFYPSQEKVAAVEDSVKIAGIQHRIYYSIPQEVINEKSVITCYIAMYEQSENARLTFRIGNNLDNNFTLLCKDAPQGGFKAGHIYSLNIDESESELLKAEERDALITFYKSTGGDNWTRNDNWCSDKPISEWYGIYTNGGENVTGIWLPENNLTGFLPPELSKLKQLSSLYLVLNKLSGSIPESFSTLKCLEEFNVAYNNMSGEIPDLSTCPMKKFHIGFNQFIGSLPEGWENMEEFGAENNYFTGGIPASHTLIMEKDAMYSVINNNLSGKIPDEISKHRNFHIYWHNILLQNSEYGFDRLDIPSHTCTVKCYDGSFLDLGEEYKKHKYTLFFMWGGDYWYPEFSNQSVMKAVSQLVNKYADEGLGGIGITTGKYPTEEISDFLGYMPNMKHFWECTSEEYDNNPYGYITNDFYLFFEPFPISPMSFFHIVDQNGNIVYWSTGVACSKNEYPYNKENIFSFVGNLFGNPYENGAYDYYTSTDYSRDGEVVTLQKATVGKGIDLVFMGEAFVDTDMEPGGKYEQKMKEAMEQYFSIEPYKTFRNRFNVYAVKVVSPNAEFMVNAVHRINEDGNVCFEYAQKVPGINTDRYQISVVYNTSTYTGRSYTAMYLDGTFVGYMMEGINTVLNHEAGGHGFAKLMDEYVEIGYENLTFPEYDKEILDFRWANWGWGANVDWRNDRNTVKWSRFLNDSRYANEGLGLFEGSYLYGYGAYRSTENSMMRYNDSPFNAPSREQIYKCIMQQSEGESWTYDYEKFVEYDAINRNTTTTRALKTQPSEAVRKEWQKRHRPPVFVKGTWRDAMKKHQQGNTVVPLR